MKITTMTFNCLIVTSLMLAAIPAYAYLDSGTGSVIVQILFSGVAGVLAILKLYWEKVKKTWLRFCHLFRKKAQKQNYR